MEQRELPLPFPELTEDKPALEARMINEYVYCPRLAYLEWVQGEWASSADTVQGSARHKRVDKPNHNLPKPQDIEETDRIHARSIQLHSTSLGLIAKLDLIKGDAEDGVIPVDYKRGKRPHVPKGAHDPERVQLCVQALLLEDHGYTVPHGTLYFIESKEHVKVQFDEALREQTLSAIHGLRLMAESRRIPPPLEDSPKCPRCSLVGICLPDEINYFRKGNRAPRPMSVQHDPAMPIYVQDHRAKVSKKGETLEISVEGKKLKHARLNDTSQLVLMGNIYVTTPTLHELMKREIPISWYSYGGWFLGHSIGVGHKNVELRTAQYQASFDPHTPLQLARGWITAKIHNSRTILRRNWRGKEKPEKILRGMKQDLDNARKAKDLDSLLGIEGSAASRYFGAFATLIKPTEDAGNFLLSFAYAMLTRAITHTLSGIGFDPYRGYYHQPRYGRPSLALDIMEPFRPLIADSTVLTVINNGEVRPSDFIRAGGGVALNPEGRKRFIGAFERRLSQETTHPIFGYRCTYRRILEIQCRLLARHLLGELEQNPNFTRN